MYKIFILSILFFAVAACSPAQRELAPTQIVDGKSIVIPPDFDVKPE